MISDSMQMNSVTVDKLEMCPKYMDAPASRLE